MAISWVLLVVEQVMLCLFFQFIVLATFIIELQHKFVTLKAEKTPSLTVCIYMLLLRRRIKKCMFYLLYAFPSLFVLVLAILSICVLSACETLCFRCQRGDKAVVLKVPLFVCDHSSGRWQCRMIGLQIGCGIIAFEARKGRFSSCQMAKIASPF